MNPPVDHHFFFGTEVLPAISLEEEFASYGSLGFEGVRFHNDDVVPGLKVKAMRTHAGSPVTAHLANSQEFFLLLLGKYRSMDSSLVAQYREARDYEALERYTIRHLLGA